MTKNLLHKTSKTYLIFTLLLLIIAAPLFYVLTEKLYIDDADEALILYKDEFLQNSSKDLKLTDIPLWNKFNRDIKILTAKPLKKDTIFYTFYYDSLNNENEPYRELNLPILIEGKPFTYSARINLVENADLIKNIVYLFSVIISILLIGLFFISKKMSIQLWKPFYKTLDQIERFEIDNYSLPTFTTSNIQEFNRLNQSIKKLIEKNTLIYQNQKEFIENAAHELQTPLAIFQAKIDTLIQRPDITKEQAEILTSLNKSISRLNRLNKNLLLLSKIENNIYTQKETFNLSNALMKHIDFFTEQAKAKNITIQIDVSKSFTISSNPILFEILINNLFLNAIRHNINNGTIQIALSEHTLSFCNSGKSNALVADKLFNRFSKSNPSSQGNGLGLAIIKKIVDHNGWSISYNFNNNHTFLINFKKF